MYRINQAFLAARTPVPRLEQGRLPCAISTFDVLARRTVTHASGDTHALVAASCAVPGVMQPVLLGGRTHVDGGVGDLLGLASCAHDERVLSVDLHTVGLLRARATHVALLGTRPGAGGALWRLPGMRNGGGGGGGWGWRRGGKDAGGGGGIIEDAVPGGAEAAVPSSSSQALRPQQPPALLRGCARLQLHGLPFVGPSNMHVRGGDAMAAGRDAMRAALATRAHWGYERVVAVPVPGSARGALAAPTPEATPAPAV
jgi:hypothetical protein